jgi:hypothetical protein
MLPFGQLISNVVSAVVGRLVSVAILGKGSERKHLARELLALDRNLIMAAELCQSVIDRLDNGSPLGIEDDYWLHETDWSASRVSSELMHTIRRLKGALERMDPPLAKALEVLYEDKFSLLMIASSSFHFDGGTLRIWSASEALCNLRLENLLRRLDGPDILEYVDWPYGAAEGGLGKDDDLYDETLITLDSDPENIKRTALVLSHLKVHRLALLDASRLVSDYIRAKFDLADVL